MTKRRPALVAQRDRAVAPATLVSITGGSGLKPGNPNFDEVDVTLQPGDPTFAFRPGNPA